MKSKTNSVRCGNYKFQPTKYDQDGNLYCAVYRINSHRKWVCKMTMLYKFNEETYDIIYVAPNWSYAKYKKMIEYFLKEYDWL